MSKMNFAKDEATKLKEQSKRNDFIKKMIQSEMVDQKKQKRDEVRQMEDQTREKINTIKEFKVKLSKDIYQSRMNEVTSLVQKKSEEIMTLEELENLRLQNL